MRERIGIIAAQHSLDNIKTAEARRRERAEIVFLPYASRAELLRIYLENLERVDGFLFSGELPYDILTHLHGPIEKPARPISLTSGDYYRIIAQILLERPDVDLSRVLFDYPMGPEVDVFRELLPPDRAPSWIAMDEDEYRAKLSNMYEAYLETCLDYWTRGETDLIVTRITGIHARLGALGIPHLLLQPCRDTIMLHFDRLLNVIEKERLETQLVACCTVCRAEEGGTEELERALHDLPEAQGLPFLADGEAFTAITSTGTMRELTAHLTACRLTEALRAALPFPILVGWGMEFDEDAARKNALRALREAQHDSRSRTYLVDQREELIGPLSGGRVTRLAIQSDARTRHLARALGVSAANLEKLTALQKQHGMTEFSAGDLMFYLDVSHRSAGRILKKLEEFGGAEPLRTARLTPRGRPSVIYRVDVDALRI